MITLYHYACIKCNHPLITNRFVRDPHCKECGLVCAFSRSEEVAGKLEVTTLLLHAVPKELKSKFKEACKKARSTMRDNILDFMEQYVKDTEKF